MITPEQMEALEDIFSKIADPINEFIITDIVTRLLNAGQITETARNEAEIARKTGVTDEKIKQYVASVAKAKKADFLSLYTAVAQLCVRQDGVKWSDNKGLITMVEAAAKLADENFTNITQTLGMIDTFGNPLPLRDAYIKATDYAVKKVMMGAQSYQEAVKEAVRNLTEYGVQVIDYESGKHAALDVAIRRDVFGGMGLMVEQIENHIHDEINADGWEISAHEACAKDHEPYQGRQYSNEEYEKLNNSLVRRIGTLNCKHMAFPIILGVNRPQYTEEQLQKMKERNDKGIEYQGKRYTMYEATQEQRRLERAMRKQRRRILAYEQNPQYAKELQKAQIRYKMLETEYKNFSNAAGLRLQDARTEVLGFGAEQMKAIKRITG